MTHTVAVDVGGTQLRVAVYGPGSLTPIHQKRILTRSTQNTAIERLIDLIASVWPGQELVSSIGIAVPGPTDPNLGIIYAAPNIPGWKNIPLRQILEDRFGVPVYLGNDANLAALGEWRYGAGQGHHNLVYLTISTGIGGGVIADGRLLLGDSGLASELGHITLIPDGPLCGCGLPGHLEAYASGTAIARYVREELAKGRASMLNLQPPPNAKEIDDAAKLGDPLAVEAISQAGRFMGYGIANFLQIFNPSIIILGGGVSRSGSYWWDAVQQSLRRSVISDAYFQSLVLTPAALGDDAGLLGALALARDGQREAI
jgi:glucokinase